MRAPATELPATVAPEQELSVTERRGSPGRFSLSRILGSLAPLSRPGQAGWAWLLLGISLILVLPLADLIVQLFGRDGEAWAHLSQTVLPRYIGNTLILAFGVMSLTGLIGTFSAWVMARYRFPGKAIFELLLILPLSLPPYIAAYSWAGVFDYGGPVRAILGLVLPASVVRSVSITNMGGAIFVMSFSLYPYLYLSLRHSIARAIAPQLEAARNLGATPSRLFFRMALPLARPALAAGLGLILMEVLNEYGAVSYYGVDTLTTGIFRAWFHYYDLSSARRIGGILLAFVFVLLTLEAFFRRGKRYYQTHQRRHSSVLSPLRGRNLTWVLAGLSFIVLAGLLIPVTQLLFWLLRTWRTVLTRQFLELSLNTLFLSLSGVFFCLLLAIPMIYARKLLSAGFFTSVSRLAFLGYAVPGAVIALGVMQLAGGMDKALGGVTGVLFSGTLPMLIYAYVIRYIPIVQRPISSVLEERFARIDEASRSLGKGPMKTLFSVHFPNMRGVLLGAGILCFLDIVKELPLTMILRPFNFNTLAVRTFELASNEQVAESALPALSLVALSALGVIILTKRAKR